MNNITKQIIYIWYKDESWASLSYIQIRNSFPFNWVKNSVNKKGNRKIVLKDGTEICWLNIHENYKCRRVDKLYIQPDIIDNRGLGNIFLPKQVKVLELREAEG